MIIIFIKLYYWCLKMHGDIDMSYILAFKRVTKFFPLYDGTYSMHCALCGGRTTCKSHVFPMWVLGIEV